MRHGSLFSGIGGFDLAAEWMGWENVFHCEWNEFGQKVLKHYWPNAISYGDITKTDFTVHRGGIDIITGGFPCQPFSVGGKRKGKEDDRYLWPEMLRTIREIQPKWIVGENVSGIISWNGGLVFNEVQTDLETEGYEVQPFVLPACAVNAPHRRDRAWFIAYTQSNSGINGIGNEKHASQKVQEKRSDEYIPFANSNKERFSITVGNGELERNRFAERNKSGLWNTFPTQPPVCSRDDGISSDLVGITVSKHRSESIKAYGNAIVPQVAFEIFKAIEQYELLTK